MITTDNALEITCDNSSSPRIPLHFYTSKPAARKVNIADYFTDLESKLRTEHLTNLEKEALTSVLKNIGGVFHHQDNKLTCTTKYNAKLEQPMIYPSIKKLTPI